MARDIIIGDIHGCYDELCQLLDELSVTPADRVISVGDIVDRGPGSVEVWELLAGRPNTVVLMGNHERKHARGVLSYSQQIVKLQMGERYQAFVEWTRGLPYYLEVAQAIVVHGGFEVGVPLSKQREDVLAGTTSGSKYLESLYPGRYWTDEYAGATPIIFGHHVVGDEVKIWRDRVYGIDTGACHGGFLSALVLPDFSVHRVAARLDYWAHQRDHWSVPVLAARDWSARPFSKIRRELRGLSADRREDVQHFAQRIATWLEQLDQLYSAIEETARQRLDQLRAQTDASSLRKVIAQQPAANVLFACLAGPLPKTLGSLLPTPDAVLAAARDLDLDLSLAMASFEAFSSPHSSRPR